MTWEDLDDVLYDGKKDDIEKVVCPDCGGMLSFLFNEYEDGDNSFTITCGGCHILSKANNGPKPNCVEFFGNEYTIGGRHG